MDKGRTIPGTVDEYIAGFPPEVGEKLEAMRKAIREAAPLAEERMAYRMPAYTLDGPLAYFAAHASHIGLYALPSAVESFGDRLAAYVTSKGTIQFPLDEDLPLDLVRDIVRFRAGENAAKAAARKVSHTRPGSGSPTRKRR